MDASLPPAGQPRPPRHLAALWARVEACDAGSLTVVLPDGRRLEHVGGAPGPEAEIVVHDAALFGRILRQGDLGFTEGYLDGLWTSPDLQALYDLIYCQAATLKARAPGTWPRRMVQAFASWAARTGRSRARANAAAHYDLGNAFYALWLDRSMTYSSALFRPGAESLETAQAAKYDAILDRLGVAPGGHVLEIGCGWGGFALHAARKRGLRVTGLTLSRKQADHARRAIAEAGLADRIDIRLTDYRDVRERFDGAASIEMIEAVGRHQLPGFFTAIHDRLKPGARAALQVITVPDAERRGYARSADFIQRHVFPGGYLPAPGELSQLIARAGLIEGSSTSLAQSYSRTLRCWHTRFDAAWSKIAAQGFDARFRRVWETYLTACAAAFAHGAVDVVQMTARRPV